MAGSKRERELHRAKVARQRKEAVEAAERRRQRLRIGAAASAVILVLAAVLGVAVAVGSGDSEDSSSDAAAASPTKGAESNGVVCKEPAKGSPSKKQYSTDDFAKLELAKKGVYTEVLTTNCGEIELTLDSENAPRTALSTLFLTDRGKFYDNTTCHRLTTDGIYVLQCGDPKGDGTGGPGYTIAEENLPEAGESGRAVYPRGTVAMANTGQPGSTGSQFFLVYQDSELPPNYTVLGKITKGMEILDHVAAKGVEGGAADGAPAQPVKIKEMVSSLTVEVESQ